MLKEKINPYQRNNVWWARIPQVDAHAIPRSLDVRDKQRPTTSRTAHPIIQRPLRQSEGTVATDENDTTCGEQEKSGPRGGWCPTPLGTNPEAGASESVRVHGDSTVVHPESYTGSYSDTEMLDWLERQGDGSWWVARHSTTGRGYRLHNTSSETGHRTPRQAIAFAMGIPRRTRKAK